MPTPRDEEHDRDGSCHGCGGHDRTRRPRRIMPQLFEHSDGSAVAREKDAGSVVTTYFAVAKKDHQSYDGHEPLLRVCEALLTGAL